MQRDLLCGDPVKRRILPHLQTNALRVGTKEPEYPMGRGDDGVQGSTASPLMPTECPYFISPSLLS